MKRIRKVEVFRAGNTSDSQEVDKYYSVDDLESIADNYDPSKHEAPIVWGHDADKAWGKSLNRNNQLANGWVADLYVENDSLYADFDVDDDTYDAIKEKKLKKRSIGFYTPKAKHNPVPGETYVRHVALLGAEPPAIKGLEDIVLYSEDLVYKDIMFNSENDDMDKDEAKMSLNENAPDWLALILKDDGEGFGETIVEFMPAPSEENNWLWNEEEQEYAGQLKTDDGSIYDFKISKDGDDWSSSVSMTEESAEKIEDEEAPTVEVEEAVVEMQEEATPEPEMIVEMEEKDDDDDSEMAELKKYKELAEKELSELRKFMEEKKAEEKQKQYAELTTFCDGIYDGGYLTEGMLSKKSLISMLIALLDNDSMVYAEGDHEVPVLDGFKTLLSALPKTVEFSEAVTARAGEPPLVKIPAQFGEVSNESKKEFIAINQYMEKNGITDFREGRRKYMSSINK